MKYFSFSLLFAVLLFSSCSKDEATFQERVTSDFIDSLGGEVSSLQWWRTAVTLKVNLSTNATTKLMLVSPGEYNWTLYDYKIVETSGIVTLTAPQGQGNTYSLKCYCKGRLKTMTINLSGKPEEVVDIDMIATEESSYAPRRVAHAASLYGNSILGGTKYYQFSAEQLRDFFKIMELSKNNVDARKVLGLNCNYELESNGPFYITWVNGYMGKLGSCILGYYYHSPDTYKDMVYVDISETHIYDYIDGLAKVQYQISRDYSVDGHTFKANTWYDANFDLTDKFGATSCMEPARAGDDAYNSQEVYLLHKGYISALRGITFKIDVPEGMRVGFYLRSEDEPWPEQWSLLRSYGIRPYVANAEDFMGTCFCAEFMNVVGNGKGLHRSFIKAYDNVIWMGMEDVPRGGDHDCNDVMFGVESDLKIHMPTIVDPVLIPSGDNSNVMPWTLAFEDVYRSPDFDFNDAVIKLEPDYENELCCVTVMAAGSPARMYLHYDGPDGDQNLGEIHQLLGSNQYYINTEGSLPGMPFVTVDCVKWPKEYTMNADAQRFYIEVQRGTCSDCTDVICLPSSPGQMPEAILVAGEWQWPIEGTHIFDVYSEFPKWARDATRTRFWEWYKSPTSDTHVSY